MTYKRKEIILAAKECVINLNLLKKEYFLYIEAKKLNSEFDFIFMQDFFDCFIPIEDMSIKILANQRGSVFSAFKDIKRYRECLEYLLQVNLSDEEALDSGFVKLNNEELNWNQNTCDINYAESRETYLKDLNKPSNKENCDVKYISLSDFDFGLNLDELIRMEEIENAEENTEYISEQFRPLSELHKQICRGYYLFLRHNSIFKESVLRFLYRDSIVGEEKVEYRMKDTLIKLVIRGNDKIIGNYGSYIFAESSKVHKFLWDKVIQVFCLNKTFGNYYEVEKFIDEVILNLHKLMYSYQNCYKIQKRYEKTYTEAHKQKKHKEEENNTLAIRVKELTQQRLSTSQIAEELGITIRKVYYLRNRKVKTNNI